MRPPFLTVLEKAASCIEDIAFENINFDYAEYKAAFAVTSLNYRDGWFQAEINDTKNILTGYLVKDSNGNYPDIHLEDGEVYIANGNAQFGVLNKENNRVHMYFTSFKMVDKATGKIEITLNKEHENTMTNLKDDFFSEIADFILPMPYSGNLIERGFSVHGVNNFTMKDCKVFSASRHGMSLQNNSGDICHSVSTCFVVRDYDNCPCPKVTHCRLPGGVPSEGSGHRWET